MTIDTKKLVHGGDWAGFEEQYGYAPADFSANVSPLGVPESVRNAVMASLDHIDRYPDPLCRKLIRELAEFESIEPEYIICGNGAADLLFRIVQAVHPGHAVITAPAFAEYEEALDAAGCRITRYRLDPENNFMIDDDFVSAITDDIDMVFMCQPNNPTGITDPKPLLLKVMRRCEEKNAVLMMDECFNDFLDDPDIHTMKPYVRECSNIVILKSFTKMYAMAGLRLGYCLSSNEDIMKKMRRMGQPWAVSYPAQEAGIAALKEIEYRDAVRSLISSERPRMIRKLQEMGLHVVPGEANYILFESIPDLDVYMRQKGILIRNCSNYHGLGEGWYRIAVKTQAENDRLLEILKGVL